MDATWATVQEVAEILGCGEEWVARRARTGVVPARKIYDGTYTRWEVQLEPLTLLWQPRGKQRVRRDYRRLDELPVLSSGRADERLSTERRLRLALRQGMPDAAEVLVRRPGGIATWYGVVVDGLVILLPDDADAAPVSADDQPPTPGTERHSAWELARRMQALRDGEQRRTRESPRWLGGGWAEAGPRRRATG